MPRPASELLFQVPTPGLARRQVRGFVKRLEAGVADGREFCCVVTSDEELRRLNREFRDRDYATDVLSFPGEPGEIAISWDAAKRQAVEYGHSVAEEIEILMLHGVLHLLGMDHETDDGEMSRAERKWRARLGLPLGLIERVSA
jgi:probable rRNA maturation factor